MRSDSSSGTLPVLLADGFLALAVFGFAAVTGTGRAWDPLLALAFAAPVAARRIAPDLAALAVIPAFLIQLAVVGYPIGCDVAAPIMIYAVAAYGHERWTRLWLLFGLGCAAVAAVAFNRQFEPIFDWLTSFIFVGGAFAAVIAAAWFMGSLHRSRLAKRQAEVERLAALQREQVQKVQLAATRERQRIASEMHDIVAHSLSVIVIQADGAQYVTRDAPGPETERLERASQAIATIAETARSALAETRRLVGVLHREDGLELAPTARLEDIEALPARLQEAGRKAQLSIEGDPQAHPPLGPIAELAAYRIVQESLTNVLKHAGDSASAWVVLHHRREGLSISVQDDGAGPTESDGQGHGLLGLHERVTAIGGSLLAQARPGGGFSVTAFIPAPAGVAR